MLSLSGNAKMVHLTESPKVCYLFRNRGKAFGGVLRPHVKHVEPALQRRGHQLVHVDIFPVKLHAANLNVTQEKGIPVRTHTESQHHL